MSHVIYIATRSIEKKILSHLFTSLFHFIKFVWSFSIIIYTKASFFAKLPGHIWDCCRPRIRLVSFSSDHCLFSSRFYCFSSFTLFLSRNQWNECPLYHNIYCIVYYFFLVRLFFWPFACWWMELSLTSVTIRAQWNNQIKTSWKKMLLFVLCSSHSFFLLWNIIRL